MNDYKICVSMGDIRSDMRELMKDMNVEALKELKQCFESQLSELNQWLKKPTTNRFIIGQ
jgi:hypothetical protein